MEDRLAFMVQQQYDEGVFKKRIGWKDNENKCAECGETRDEGSHELDDDTDPADYHEFIPSKNEVAYLYERLKGLVTIKHKKDCLQLPDKRYRKIICKPTPSILRLAEAVAQSAPNAVTGMTLLRELSDGFQYREEQQGMTRCTYCTDGTVSSWSDPQDADRSYPGTNLLPPEIVARLVESKVPCPMCGGCCEVPKMVRITRELDCPKVAALKMLLDENEETGRIVVFAGFTGSVDKTLRRRAARKLPTFRCERCRGSVIALLAFLPIHIVGTPRDEQGVPGGNGTRHRQEECYTCSPLASLSISFCLSRTSSSSIAFTSGIWNDGLQNSRQFGGPKSSLY